ncbi:MAG: hypothetical protein K6F16_03930 [Lachnospiraceae bacterium]|nr:hypothetical protein [Lachnospiraceae bacterium]
MKIMWTNTFSGEQGFVREIKPDHFENTYTKEEGASFRNRREAERAIEQLIFIGEGANNIFEVVTNK